MTQKIRRFWNEKVKLKLNLQPFDLTFFLGFTNVSSKRSFKVLLLRTSAVKSNVVNELTRSSEERPKTLRLVTRERDHSVLRVVKHRRII